jgi:hypothetical protein
LVDDSSRTWFSKSLGDEKGGCSLFNGPRVVVTSYKNQPNCRKIDAENGCHKEITSQRSHEVTAAGGHFRFV